MVKLNDISIYFTPQCCISQENLAPAPCRNSPHPTKVLDYFEYYYNNGTDVYVTTITIGRKWIGKKTDKQQYEQMIKDIKKHIKYGSEQSYIYHFEHQTNGQVHAHGLEINTSQAQFIESFDNYGKRNSHSKSFQKCRNLAGYHVYVNKENAFPPIHNVTKKKLHCCKQLKRRRERHKVI